MTGAGAPQTRHTSPIVRNSTDLRSSPTGAPHPTPLPSPELPPLSAPQPMNSLSLVPFSSSCNSSTLPKLKPLYTLHHHPYININQVISLSLSLSQFILLLLVLDLSSETLAMSVCIRLGFSFYRSGESEMEDEGRS
ncbi:unnamed protein product [Lactuca virosa]|uniref:Uncharacterized protein n=1 Tax=Lactuca virosa TaxID=75947 RepID=A0AAU9LLY1_9ASTR|nr:unnamed protein product [Lactuca virosa]